jgi:hypothetical protein
MNGKLIVISILLVAGCPNALLVQVNSDLWRIGNFLIQSLTA